MSLPKDHAQLLKFILKHGWKRKKDGVGHWRLIGPEGQEVRASNTPHDKYFSGVKLRNDLIKAGFRLKTRGPYIPPPPPKLVIDKSAATARAEEIVVTEEAKKEGKMPRGSIRPIIVEVMQRLGDAPNGRAGIDLMTHVNAKDPKITQRQVEQALTNMASTGRVTRVSAGRFRLVEGAPARKPKAAAANVEQGDMAVLEESLAMLGKLEKLIKKYQELAGALAKLR